ncbi:MAG: hypothetical protein WCO40_02130 [Thermoleophilia bacterium]
MKRIEVDPSDVRVVQAETWSYTSSQPTGGEPRPFLRRHRAKFALALAIIELIALGFGPGNFLHQWLLLLAIAFGAVFLHAVIARYLPYNLRQLTWIFALTQALVALFPIFLGVGVVIIVILLVFAVLAGVALLLGDRR